MAPVIVATGFTREVRTVEGPGVVAIAGGGVAERLEQALHDTATQGASGIVSYGLTGALADGLRIGDWIVGDHLTGAVEQFCHPGWRDALAARLPGARIGAFFRRRAHDRYDRREARPGRHA